MHSPAVKTWVVMPYSGEHWQGVLSLLNANGWTSAAPTAALMENAHLWGAAFVATDGAAVIGFARIISDGQVVSYLSELVTDTDWRGQGVGRALVQACMTRFPSARLDLLSSEAGRGFYEHIGMVWETGYRKWPG